MKKLIAANWKMYKTVGEAHKTAEALRNILGKAAPKDREVIIFPQFTAIKAVSDVFSGCPGLFTGGQNFYPAPEGAFTGEISLGMLSDCGASWVLVGHSERRSILGECDEIIGRKTCYAYGAGFNVLLCVGETLAQRDAGELEKVLATQLEHGLKGLPGVLDWSKFAIAYEPVWAIGTGKVAGPEEIAQAHKILRAMLHAVSPAHGDNTRILYGGSVKPDNAASILAVDNVDGVLVGGASLEADNFSKIVTA